MKIHPTEAMKTAFHPLLALGLLPLIFAGVMACIASDHMAVMLGMIFGIWAGVALTMAVEAFRQAHLERQR